MFTPLPSGKSPPFRDLLRQLRNAIEPEDRSAALRNLIEHYPKSKLLWKELAKLQREAELGTLHPEHAIFLVAAVFRLGTARPSQAVRLFVALSKYAPIAGWREEGRQHYLRHLAEASAKLRGILSATDLEACRTAVKTALDDWGKVLCQRAKAERAFLEETMNLLYTKRERIRHVALALFTGAIVIGIVVAGCAR